MFRTRISTNNFISPREKEQLAEDFRKVYAIENNLDHNQTNNVLLGDLGYIYGGFLFSSPVCQIHAHANIFKKIEKIMLRFSKFYPDASPAIVTDLLLADINPEQIPLSVLKMLMKHPHSQISIQKVFDVIAENLCQTGQDSSERLTYILEKEPNVSVFNRHAGLYNSIMNSLPDQVEFLFQLADQYQQQCAQPILDNAFFILVEDLFYKRVPRSPEDEFAQPPYLERHYAKHERIAKLLIDHGANVLASHKEYDGTITTPKKMAEKNHYEHFLKMIDAAEQQRFRPR